MENNSEFNSIKIGLASPEQIRASQDEKFVTLEWNHSTDRETPKP